MNILHVKSVLVQRKVISCWSLIKSVAITLKLIGLKKGLIKSVTLTLKTNWFDPRAASVCIVFLLL